MNMLIESEKPARVMQDDNVISLEDVSVLYRIPRERMSGIKEYTIRWLQRRLEYEEFWALNGVSFTVNSGEIFGVIGRNGSGKSTLLKVVARVLFPTRGRVQTRGRVAPLLELGAGFQPELTGRENIYINSALLGHPREEVERILPEILDFAEVSDFIDAPLRTYSTGMMARLGFAVATGFRPELLLVDEVLAVGDSQFQKKCLDRMFSYQKQGTTILLVSHSMGTIEEFCDRAAWLDHGKLMAYGKAADVIDAYKELDSGKKTVHVPAVPVENAVIEGREYTELNGIGNIYPAASIFRVDQGSVTLWMRAEVGEPAQDSVVFHTDDSRFVLYTNVTYSPMQGRYVRRINARAGGNKRVYDTFFGGNVFPEVHFVFDDVQAGGEPFSIQDWHQVTMTWLGYPEGAVRLYIDGKLIRERAYDSQYDNGSSLPVNIAIGMRPSIWTGELIYMEDGSVIESRPYTTMSIINSGWQIVGLRLYLRSLSEEEIRELATHRPPV